MSTKKIPAVQATITVAVVVAVAQEFHHVRKQLHKTAGYEREEQPNDYCTVYIYEEQVGATVVRFVLAKLPEPVMGGDAAAWLSTYLSETYRPFCLCAVGLCAGHNAHVDHGDVIIATATRRTDFGKLIKHISAPSAVMKHRDSTVIRDTSILPAVELEQFATEQTKKGRGRKVLAGVMATGNQVVKVDGVFDYLHSQLMSGASGDESNRSILALEMEAHAVAFSATRSGVPIWLVIKGVCDYADINKSDDHRDNAMSGAFDVMFKLVRERVVAKHANHAKFGVLGRKLEDQAHEAYVTGELTKAADKAQEAYALGRRSLIARREYIRALMRRGLYDEAFLVLEAHAQRPWFNDAATAEQQAEIALRRRDYSKGLKILTPLRAKGHRQLMYLRAMLLLFQEERASTLSGKSLSRKVVTNCEQLLRDALGIRSAVDPWWIRVNLYFVSCLTLIESPAQLEKLYASALKSLSTARVSSRNRRGVVLLYLLLLHALADKKADFDALCMANHDRVEVALDHTDMVLERIAMRFRGRDVEKSEYFRRGVMRWALETDFIGRPVRKETWALLNELE